MPPSASQAAHTVAGAFVAGAVLRLDIESRARVLAACGVNPLVLESPGARVDAAAFGRLWLAVARELDDEFFGLDSRRMKVGSFALLCRALLSHQSVGGALREAQRGFALFLDDVRVELTAERRRARLALHNRIATPAARRFADEALLVMLHGLLCWLAGRRVPIRAAHFAWPRPPHAAEYRRMFGPTLRFEAPLTTLEFDAALLASRHAASAATLREFLRDAPQSVFLKQVGGARWAQRLRARLRRGGDWPSVEAVAAEWGVSVATLRRRLSAEGTGWQPAIDELRRDLALRLLADGRHSIEAVAVQLGYVDARSLQRAFRRWTGSAPGGFRGARADQ
ncbi:MAG: AraC family transcriptional regulator ligand-binding domain-containing protein [Burkholderiaceae bacterium]|nr:AraC family transcriptional regulator ligand-binding domain-containing protein [Burkholderiaceae bacterium]